MLCKHCQIVLGYAAGTSWKTTSRGRGQADAFAVLRRAAGNCSEAEMACCCARPPLDGSYPAFVTRLSNIVFVAPSWLAVWIGALAGVAISIVIGIVFIIIFYVANSKIFSGHAQARPAAGGWLCMRIVQCCETPGFLSHTCPPLLCCSQFSKV